MMWVLIITIIWLVILSVIMVSLRNHYKRLIEVGGKKDLIGILEKILDRLEEDRMNIDKLNKLLEKSIYESQYHIQKVGLVRFNPFPDTGGEQSFILSLLDNNNSGIVISSLHARATTRWYAKNVVLGKGKDIELSKEEERAIKEAGSINLKSKSLNIKN